MALSLKTLNDEIDAYLRYDNDKNSSESKIPPIDIIVLEKRKYKAILVKLPLVFIKTDKAVLILR